MRDGVLQKVMPFRGVEVVAHLKRKRNKMDGGKMKAQGCGTGSPGDDLLGVI